MFEDECFTDKCSVAATIEHNFSRNKWLKQVCSEFVPKVFLDGICCEMVHVNLAYFHELLRNSFHVTEKNLSGSFMESSLHLNHCAKSFVQDVNAMKSDQY